jgi:hypothetical protein
MAALDAKARATALKLLNKFGKSVTLTMVTEGTYNPATGELSSGSTSTEIPKALIEDFNGVDYVSGLVEKGDRKVTTPASGYTEPKPNDQFTVGSDVYTVIAVETVWSGEQAAIYISQVRK